MQKLITVLFVLFIFSTTTEAQFQSYKFGDGIKVTSQDSSFYLRFGFRFQNLAISSWRLADDGTQYSSNLLVRRSRLKFDGHAYSPKLKYKLELGLTNRDVGGGIGPEFNNGANIVLDAYAAYSINKNWTIQFGQTKLPGNRERVVSSANLQLVDRSRLNSRFNIDRDVGLQLKHTFKVGSDFIFREAVAFSQGEGRDVTGGHFGGYDYTFRVEMLPFGSFTSKGDYIGSAIKRESTAKLSIGATYDINKNAVRERGQLGSFIRGDDGNYYGKDLKTFFADMMFKYQGLSIASEYADKATGDEIPTVFDNDNNVVGTFYTGSAFTAQVGYMFDNNIEMVLRFTDMNPDEEVANDEIRWTFGLNKFFSGHQLKIQTDFQSIRPDGGTNRFVWRTQMDVHF